MVLVCAAWFPETNKYDKYNLNQNQFMFKLNCLFFLQGQLTYRFGLIYGV